jgi:hypothetical protein
MNKREARIKALRFASGAILADADELHFEDDLSWADADKIASALRQIAASLDQQADRLDARAGTSR